MIRGFNTAGSGMIAQSRKIDVTGGNISNSRTAGYKRDTAVTTSFNDQLLIKLDNTNQPVQIGTISPGIKLDGVSTEFQQGLIQETGSPLDLAIEGEGFFTVAGANGTVQYTRNGQFKIDAQGYLVNSEGGMLMGDNGPINVNGKVFKVSSDGNVDVDGATIDKLLIYNPAAPGTMVKNINGMFTDTAPSGQAFTGKIVQGSIEASNTDMTRDMVDLMSSQRTFQACSAVVKMIDSTLAKTVDIGKIS